MDPSPPIFSLCIIFETQIYFDETCVESKRLKNRAVIFFRKKCWKLILRKTTREFYFKIVQKLIFKQMQKLPCKTVYLETVQEIKNFGLMQKAISILNIKQEMDFKRPNWFWKLIYLKTYLRINLNQQIFYFFFIFWKLLNQQIYVFMNRKKKKKLTDFSTIVTILMDLAYPKGLKPIIDMHKILRTNKIEVISSEN